MMTELLILKYEPLQPVLYDDLQYRAGNFATHLSGLRELGYNSITTADLVAHIRDNSPLPEKPLMITFDTGYAVDYEYGVPALLDMGFNATFFIAGEYIIKSTCKDPEYTLDYMNIEQVRSLYRHGFDIGLQSFSNLSFNDHSIAEIENDIKKNISFFRKFSLPYSPVFALPADFRVSLFSRPHSISRMLSALGFEVAFQCTNKLNKNSSAKHLYLDRIQTDEEYPVETLKRQISDSSSRWFQ